MDTKQPPTDEDDELARLRAEVAVLKDKVLDYEDAIERLQGQHDILENFCFGLEREHDRARTIIEATQAELVESYQRLRELKEQQDDILENVRQGLITIARDGRINGEYSAATARIFERSDLAGLPFTALFAHDDALRARVQRFLDVQFGSPWAETRMLAKLNPLAECRYTVSPSADEKVRKVLSFSFVRIFAPDENGQTQHVAKLMVVIDDRTLEYELNEELERRVKEQSAKVEKVYQILVLPPEVFVSFGQEADGMLATSAKLLADLRNAPAPGSLDDLVRTVHTLKGNARALGLESVSRAAHDLEETLVPFRTDTRAITPRALDAADQRLKRLRTELQDGQSLFDKVLDIRQALRASDEQRSGELELALQRLVRVEAETLGKSVELTFEDALPGGLPTHLALRVKNAVIQLLRNAVGHGIEPPDVRTKLGKAPHGRIDIKLFRSQEHILITCRDDGQGLDPEVIRAAAVARRVVPETEAQALSDSQVLDLIFVPGFTTAERIDEVAGRGVGMDIVKESVEAIGGAIGIRTERSRFTEFTMTIPHRDAMRSVS